MPKTKISEYSATNSSNTDIEGINIDEGCAPSGINNAIRELMVHLKEFQTGASGDAFTFAGGTLMSGTNTISGSAIISGNINSSGSANTFSGGVVHSGTNTFSSSVIMSGNINSSGTNTFSGSNVMSFSGGSSASPSIYFASDTNTGIFSPAADTVAIAAGGSNKAQFGTGSAIIDGLTVGRGAGAVSTNTAVGASALAANTSGASNTAIGVSALLSNTTASDNTAVGYQAGYSNTTGTSVDAFGYQALYSNTTGVNNSAFGFFALNANTTGTRNSAFSRGALAANTTGSNNTSMGISSLNSNTTGSNNVAFGDTALLSNTTASSNTAFGYQAGYSNTTGGDDTLIGARAGYNLNASSNTFVGKDSGYYVTSGAKNTIIGRFDGNQGGLDIRTASNHIVLSDGDGNVRAYIDNNGYVLAQGVYDRTIANAANVFVLSNGALYRSTSSLKYKHDVQNYVKGLEDLLKLRPVTYKGTGDADGDTVFAGLIAEEVDAVGLTEFVQYADDGSPDALAYGNMVSLCIKAIQELKAEVDSLKAQINGASA